MAGRLLDQWEDEVDKQRRAWQELADSSAALSSGSGRTGHGVAGGGLPASTGQPTPSSLGREVEQCLTSLADIIQHGVARALTSRKHHEEESTVNLAISTSGGDKKKKKKKPPKIHLVPVKMEKMKTKEDTRGFSGKAQTWTIGEKLNDTNARKGRGIIEDMWAAGQKGIDGLAEHVLEAEQKEDGLESVEEKDVGEMRGKKKKKKKAILKLLILGAILKAKIGTLLQILSFKLQVKFFLIALIGLGINLARFWLDVKKQHTPPQKVRF
ncbi:hypothetical protein NE865_04336 [Phthorimaea operculella]|nr:hypothetical protein NE865_04336 [Phthorimaea operculella]